MLAVLVAPLQLVYADNLNGGGAQIKLENPLKNVTTVEGLIAAVLDFIVKIGTVIAVFFVILSGFQFVLARGNPEGISKAKTTFLWTIVGALILIGAKVLSEVICNTANQLGAGATCK